LIGVLIRYSIYLCFVIISNNIHYFFQASESPNYIKKVETPWSAQEIVDVWAKYYGPNFSEVELDKLIEFYTSDLGKKDVAVTKQTMAQFTEHFQKAAQPIYTNAINEYIEELKIVASECKCSKKKPLTTSKK